MPIRVTIAEDSALVRAGLEMLIGSRPELELVDVCQDLDSLLASVAADPPDVVLTDIRMPPSGTDEGVQVAQRLRTSSPRIGVVVLRQDHDAGAGMPLADSFAGVVAAGHGGASLQRRARKHPGRVPLGSATLGVQRLQRPLMGGGGNHPCASSRRSPRCPGSRRSRCPGS